MDSNITSLPPDPHASHADAASRPRAALPGEDTLQSHGAGVKGSGTANPVDGIVTDPAMSLQGACRGGGQYGARAYLWLDMRALVEYVGSAAVRTE